MSISFQAKEPQVLSRQLQVQELSSICNLVTPSTDAPSIVTLGGVLAARTITFDIGEALDKCFSVSVTNRATGAIVATTAVPDLSVANKITVTVDGTGISSACISVKYQVTE